MSKEGVKTGWMVVTRRKEERAWVLKRRNDVGCVWGTEQEEVEITGSIDKDGGANTSSLPSHLESFVIWSMLIRCSSHS